MPFSSLKVPHPLSSIWLVGINLFDGIDSFYANPSCAPFCVKSMDLMDGRSRSRVVYV